MQTHTAHATFGPFNKIDPLVSTRKPEAGFVGDDHDKVRAHGLYCDLAIGRRFTVQFQAVRYAMGEVVGLPCRKP